MTVKITYANMANIATKNSSNATKIRELNYCETSLNNQNFITAYFIWQVVYGLLAIFGII